MPFLEKLNLSQNSGKTLIFLLLPLLLLIIVFPAAYQPEQVFISEYHDTMALMMPELFLMQNPIALWDNQWITGFPEIANLNTDRFYPFSFPLSMVAQNIFVINLILLLNLYIAYLTFWKLGSLLVKNTNLLMVFSLGYMFSGVLISRISIGHISFVYAMAWIPLVYYFFLKITHDSELTTFNIIALGLSETLLLFTGGIYYVFFGNAILSIFFLYYLYDKTITKSKFYALVASVVLFFSISAIKIVPNFLGIPYIQRIDLINPLGDGGSLENNFASFVFGTPIDNVFGSYETMALIGIIPILFAIIALIWGKKQITVPSFLAILFSLIWADGGRILLSGIHLLPLVDSFRNAGRIFGAITPIVLLLSIYGVYILEQKIKNSERFEISGEQKRNIIFGVIFLFIIKILELPWIAAPSLEAATATILIFGFILMVYLNKTNITTLKGFFIVSLVIDGLILIKNFTILDESVLIKGLFISISIIAVLLFLNWKSRDKILQKQHFFTSLLVVGILLSIIGNISVLQPSDPHLNDSPALKIIEKIKQEPTDTPQLWVYEIGWPIKHMDFTYWMIQNNIHPMRAFYSFLPLYTPPLALNISNMTYFTADYIIDTAYLENGNQNLPDVTFKVDNISVYRPENVLSNAFVVRNNKLVPVKFEKFTPDEVVISGQFLSGDVAILKTAYYPGWKINGFEATKIADMAGLTLPTDTTKITFRFDPLDAKIGALLTVAGIIALIILIVKRKEFEQMLQKMDSRTDVKKFRKGKKE